jgi:hypothetical protein
MAEYNAGGFISGGMVTAWVTPDECLIRPDDTGQWHCVRQMHTERPSLCQERRPDDHGAAWLRWVSGGTP